MSLIKELKRIANHVFNSQSLRDDDLATAIFSNDEAHVLALLRKGANPNALVNGREHMIAYAVRRSSNDYIFRALLDAGADVRPPFVKLRGDQCRLSEAARDLQRPLEIVELLRAAEKSAEAQYGSLPLLRERLSSLCQL
jgi:hypothetical protein